MGRQHTTWISEENWRKLENIGGDSTSAKIGNAISMADPDREMVINAKMRQLGRAKDALTRINALLVRENLEDLMETIGYIESIIEEVWWLVDE